jgi:hypothetical protein
MQRRWGLFLSGEHPAFAQVMRFLQIPMFMVGDQYDYVATKDGSTSVTTSRKHADTFDQNSESQ